MPKDYRDRRIDDKPPRVHTKHTKRTTTSADPDVDGSSAGEDLVLPPETPTVATGRVRPGDGVLWFWRRNTSAGAPSGRKVTLKTLSDGAVTFTYAASPSGWANYITSAGGNFEYQTNGIDVLTDETVYVIWDQFVGFTAGDYKFVFTLADGSIDRAILLHGVNPDNPGTFYAGMSQTPTWSVAYSGLAAENKVDHFDVTVPTAGGVKHLVYGIWQMSGAVDAPAALYTAPSSVLLTYALTNPVDPPALRKRTIVTYVADTLPTTTSITVPAPFEAGWAGQF
jgi:hypothetical protein